MPARSRPGRAPAKSQPATGAGGEASAGARAEPKTTAKASGDHHGPDPDLELHTVIAEVVAAGGYDLEEVSLTPAGRRRVLKVLIDADGGVDLDQVAEVTRALSQRLDAPR